MWQIRAQTHTLVALSAPSSILPAANAHHALQDLLLPTLQSSLSPMLVPLLATPASQIYPIFFFKSPASDVCGTSAICVNLFDAPALERILSTFNWQALKTNANGKLFLVGLAKQLAAAALKTLFGGNAPNAVQVNAQDVVDAQDAVSTCGLDAVGCCLPGAFGIDGRVCTNCPIGQTSPYAVPSASCSCPNTLSSSCRSCSICETLGSMNQCVSKCPGKKCSLTSNTKATPKITAGVCF